MHVKTSTGSCDEIHMCISIPYTLCCYQKPLKLHFGSANLEQLNSTQSITENMNEN